jgi:biotin carboxyl carrier protein
VRLIAKHDGEEFPVEVERAGSGYRVKIGDRWIGADLIDAGPFLKSLRLDDGTQFSLLHHREGNVHQVTLSDRTIHVELTDPLSAKRRRREDETSGSGVIKALMPGRIVRVMVEEGAIVTKGAGLLILEAMKMENEIQAPFDGTVTKLLVQPGVTVESGAELAHLEAEGAG